MHNGCLLLLAFVAVFQPITAYSERGLVDGRQQRCDSRTSERDPGLNFHGTYRFNKPAVEDRRLNDREDTREVRRNEVREENLRWASSNDRRLADTLERDRNTLARLTRNRIGDDAIIRRQSRDTRLVSNRRDERNQEIRRERLSRLQEQGLFDSRGENIRLSEDEIRSQRIDNRVLLESRRDVRRSGISEATQRVREQQKVRVDINRVRGNGAISLNDRRITRPTRETERMNNRRSESRIQRDGNADRETVGRRFSSYDDAAYMDQNNRRTINSERFLNEQRQRDSRIRLRVERRNTRDSDRTSARFQSANNRNNDRYTENKARLARAVRSVGNVASQNDRSDSRVREMAAENRRNLREARNTMRARSLDFRSSERVLESRRDNRNIEGDTRQNIINNRVTEIQNNDRDTCVYDRELSAEHRITRILSERPQENRRLARNVESRAFKTEQTSESRQGFREAVTRVIRPERIDRSGQDTRTIGLRSFRAELSDERHQDTRKQAQEFKTERIHESRRDARNVAVRSFRAERSTRLFRHERASENLREVADAGIRAFRTEHTEQSRREFRTGVTDETRRAARNVELRVLRTESTEENRRGGRNFEDRASRTVRADENRFDARKVGIRAFRSERTEEYQLGARNIELRAGRQSRSLDRITDSRWDRQNNNRNRVQERTHGNRRNVRNIEFSFEADRGINRRVTRSLERDIRSMGRESATESRLNIQPNKDSRKFTMERLSADRRIPITENHRDVRNVYKGRRSLDSQERVESRRMNLVRSSDNLSLRKTERGTEHLSNRDSIDSRRTYTIQQKSQRGTERTYNRENLSRRQEYRNDFDIDFARKRELQNKFKNPTQTEYESPIMNWQHVFYVLQGLYICGLLMQLNKGNVEKKTRASWWPTSQHLIKVD